MEHSGHQGYHRPGRRDAYRGYLREMLGRGQRRVGKDRRRVVEFNELMNIFDEFTQKNSTFYI